MTVTATHHAPYLPPGEKGYAMSPPRDTRDRDSTTDATKLRFDWQLVIMILSVAASIWASQYGLRSDVRDIRTRMELQSKVDEAQGKLQETGVQALRESIADMRRRQELQQYEIQSLKETILKQQGTRP